MIPAAQTAIREMQAKSTEIHMERARLEGVLCALCDVAGFEATVAAVQGALQRLAAQERASGNLPSGWVS
jgi:hypothetical protein